LQVEYINLSPITVFSGHVPKNNPVLEHLFDTTLKNWMQQNRKLHSLLCHYGLVDYRCGEVVLRYVSVHVDPVLTL